MSMAWESVCTMKSPFSGNSTSSGVSGTCSVVSVPSGLRTRTYRHP